MRKLQNTIQKAAFRMGSVVGPVIQANGRLSFEDDLRSGGLLYSEAAPNNRRQKKLQLDVKPTTPD